jgi:hypothetical protein
VWGAVVYILGTWWGKAYVLGIILSVALFTLEEHLNIQKWGDVPGLEARRGEGVIVGVVYGLFMGLLWPIWIPMLGWVGLRELYRRHRRPVT